MKANFSVFTAAFLGICGCAGGAAGQSLPSNVEPGVQRDRLLDRDMLPRSPGPAVLQVVDCSAGEIALTEPFALKGVRLDSEVAVGDDIDPTAYWAEYLGRLVTLEQVCAIARDVAGGFERETGRNLSAILPVQYIDGGIVRISIVTN